MVQTIERAARLASLSRGSGGCWLRRCSLAGERRSRRSWSALDDHGFEGFQVKSGLSGKKTVSGFAASFVCLRTCFRSAVQLPLNAGHNKLNEIIFVLLRRRPDCNSWTLSSIYYGVHVIRKECKCLRAGKLTRKKDCCATGSRFPN
jgi:hypothetical protein